jgi:hypothetical protein
VARELFGLSVNAQITIDVLGDVDHVIVKIVEFSHQRPDGEPFCIVVSTKLLSLIIPAQSPSSDDSGEDCAGGP